MKQEARVLLARAYLQNPKWVRRAQETLQCAVDEDGPPNVEALFLLGTIYAGQGLKRRAEALLRRALALQPDHGPAAAELRALSREPLVRRLFARRA
jgi:Tfp pilus assembly protein PilF